jgi:hypothetical protein
VSSIEFSPRGGSVVSLSPASLKQLQAYFAHIPLFRIGDYGGSTSKTAAENATALQSADAAAAAAGGGTIHVPAGVWAHAGAVTISKGNRLLGDGPGLTKFDHTGNNVAFTYDGQKAGVYSDDDIWSVFEGFSVLGNTGASAWGVELQNTQHFTMRNVIIGGVVGDRYTVGGGLLVHNNVYWNENLQLENVALRYNKVGIGYLRDGSGTASMSYHRYRGVSINVPASGIGMDVGMTGTEVDLLVGDLDVNIWLEGNSAQAVVVRDACVLDQTTMVNIRGEVLGGATGTQWLANAGTFGPRGLVTFPYGGPAGIDLTGADRTDLSAMGDGLEANARFGFLAKTGEPIGQAAITTQVVAAGGLLLHAGQVITNIIVCAQVAGIGAGVPTSLKLGLWSSAATPVCLAVTAELKDDARWLSQGWKVCALTAPYTIPTTDIYYPCFWENGAFTTPLQLVISHSPGAYNTPIGSGKRMATSLKTTTTMAVSDTGTYAQAGSIPLLAVS